MKNKLTYRLPTDLARDPATGSLRRIDFKPLSRRKAHRMGLFHKTPSKRPGYVASNT